MSKSEIKTSWKGKMAFESDVFGQSVKMDADEKVGGENNGARPKALLLSGLAGCTGMDVVSILNKMRVFPDEFDIDIQANMTEEHPKVYDEIHLIYRFKGNDLPIEKLEKAVNLSQERYCGVSAMLAKAAKITHEIIVD